MSCETNISTISMWFFSADSDPERRQFKSQDSQDSGLSQKPLSAVRGLGFVAAFWPCRHLRYSSCTRSHPRQPLHLFPLLTLIRGKRRC